MLNTKLHDTIAAIDRAGWDSIGSDPLSTHAILSILEKADLPGIRIRYATVEDDAGHLLAAAPITRIDVDGKLLTHGFFRRIIGAIRIIFPRFLRTALIICGTPLSVGNPPVRIAEGVDAGPILAELATLLERLGRSEHAPWLAFKEFPTHELEAARSALEADGSPWFVAPSEPNMSMQIEWTSYEQYLSCLRSHYRYKIRSAAKLLEREDVVVDVVPLGEFYDSELHSLYDAVVDRAVVKLEHLTPEFFIELGRTFGGDAQLIRFIRDGRVIGWIAVLFSEGVAYDLFHGIDYSESESTALYFNQLAAVVRLAIDRDAHRLSLGQSTETAKSRFGGEPVPLWIVLRHSNRLINRIVRYSRRMLFPDREVPTRHVFRTAEPGVTSP